MKLEDLYPSLPTFSLQVTGKTYHLRIPTLEDKARFTEWAGGPDFSGVFKEVKWDLVVKFIYKLLVEKDDFLASNEEVIDDDGVKKTRLVTGPEKLFRSISGSTKESTEVFMALCKAVSRGEPEAETAIANLESGEKKRVKKSTGDTSSTSFATSTATPQQSLAV